MLDDKRIVREVPEKVFMYLEDAMDSIVEEVGEDALFHGPIRHMIERQFRFMFRDRFHDYIRKRGRGDAHN